MMERINLNGEWTLETKTRGHSPRQSNSSPHDLENRAFQGDLRVDLFDKSANLGRLHVGQRQAKRPAFELTLPEEELMVLDEHFLKSTGGNNFIDGLCHAILPPPRPGVIITGN